MLSMLVRVADILFVVLGAFIANFVRFDRPFVWSGDEATLFAFAGLLTMFLFPRLDIYQSWRGQKMIGLLSRVLTGWLLAAMLALVVIFVLHRTGGISRLWFGVWLTSTAVLQMSARALIHSVLGRMRSHGMNQKGLAIVGSIEYSRGLVKRVQASPGAGFMPICIFDERAAGHESVRGVAVTNSFDELVGLVRKGHLHEIWLAVPLSEELAIRRFVGEFRNDFVNIRFIPDIRSFALFDHSVGDVLGLPAINLSQSRRAEVETLPKQLFDRLFAASALIALLPVFAVLAVMVKSSSPGPIFFRQRRKGVDGREFTIYKFRSMHVHKELPGQLTQAVRHDSRVTPIGAFMRKTSLDELPQFINVFLGDMSVVGPRPHAIEHDNIYKDLIDGYMYRYRIKPGITGWAQINGFRGQTDKVELMAERVRYDLFYIQNWTFWLDVKIVLLTIIKGFAHRNAF